MENRLTYSYSPHIKSDSSVRRIMADVCIALLPALITGVIYFGFNALLLTAISVFSATASEFLFLIIRGKTLSETARQFDFSSVVTGLLIAFSIGTNYPWYAPVFGSAFAVIVVKMLFGGTGKNLVNPAVTGRIFIFISFQWAVGAWSIPFINSVFANTANASATAVTQITAGNPFPYSVLDAFLGTGMIGCIGETCKPALLLGLLYLSLRKVINPLFPALYIAVCGLTAVCISGFDFSLFLPSVLSGGLFLGAIFMATDYVTTPNTFKGNVLYFILLGIVTAVLRFATKMETVSFAILLMNLTVPLIDKFVLNRPFGSVSRKKKKENNRG